MSKVLCFGELLLRLSPQLHGQWIEKASMPVFIGGAELNVGRALALWKNETAYCTRLPRNYLSAEIESYIKSAGIESRIQYGGQRIGTYYLPQGADLKNAGVIYDRAHSSFYDLQPGMLDWDAILNGVDWFHFSAISPALNEAVADVCLEGVQAAHRKGITVSVDLNYREKLWQYGKSPAAVMPRLVEYCNVVMGNIWAASVMLDIPVPGDIKKEKTSYIEQSQRTADAIFKAYPECRQVANTFRFDEGEGVRYYATLQTGKGFSISQEHIAKTITDKVGSGDTFMAGLIHGNRQQWNEAAIISFAAAAAFNKLFIKGDATTSSVEDIQKGSHHAKETVSPAGTA